MNRLLYYPGYNQYRMNKLVEYFDPRIDYHKKSYKKKKCQKFYSKMQYWVNIACVDHGGTFERRIRRGGLL